MTASERAAPSHAGGAGQAPWTERARPARAADSQPVRRPEGRGSTWWKHFLVWAVVLSVPCWVLADAYHAGLNAAMSLLLGLSLPRQPSGEIEVHATHVLGIFAAMCLATVRAPMHRRLWAVAIGLPLLFALELSTGLIAVGTELLARSGGLSRSVLKFRDQALLAPPWLGAPLIWLLFLGRWEFPTLRSGDRGASVPRSGPRAKRGNARRACRN